MTYQELVTAIQGYTENQFPVIYLADGTTESTSTQINRFIEQAEQRIYNTIQFPSLRSNAFGITTANIKYLACPNDFLSVYSLAVIDSSGNYNYLLNKDVNFIRAAYPNPGNAYSGLPQYYALFGPQSSNVNELAFILGPTPDQSYNVELHYYYYPPSIIQGVITTLGNITPGSGYINGTYYDVPITGGTGNSATATVVVSNNVVTSITITGGGCYYIVGDSISVSSNSIGGSGGGFSVPVLTVANSTGTTWLGDNYDSVLLYGSLVEAYTFMKGEQDIITLYNSKYTEALAEAKRLGDALERQDAYRSGQYRQAVT